MDKTEAVVERSRQIIDISLEQREVKEWRSHRLDFDAVSISDALEVTRVLQNWALEEAPPIELIRATAIVLASLMHECEDIAKTLDQTAPFADAERIRRILNQAPHSVWSAIADVGMGFADGEGTTLCAKRLLELAHSTDAELEKAWRETKVA